MDPPPPPLFLELRDRPEMRECLLLVLELLELLPALEESSSSLEVVSGLELEEVAAEEVRREEMLLLAEEEEEEGRRAEEEDAV